MSVFAIGRRETNEEIDVRVQELLQFVASRPEDSVAVIGHSSFLQRLFQVRAVAKFFISFFGDSITVIRFP